MKVQCFSSNRQVVLSYVREERRRLKSLSPIGFIYQKKIKLQIQILDTALSLKADAIKCFAPEVTLANS